MRDKDKLGISDEEPLDNLWRRTRWRPQPHALSAATGYQPGWEDGHEVGTALRQCNSRYLAIEDHLKHNGWQYTPSLNEPMTVLDLGAYTGYFCKRLHDTFGAQCVAVDNQPRLKASEGVRVIKELLNPGRIRRELGHFDVALCLSVLHHHADWYDYITALRESADLCFFETASLDEPLGSYRGYAAGAEEVLTDIGTIIARTPPMHGQHLRPLWAVPGIDS
jgi:2-polyprenyl-3-methyl-5-hydroxy-6-metoxy-1,4-benzoquinol methylase